MTLINNQRQSVSAGLRGGLFSSLSSLVALAPLARPGRRRRPPVFGLDERMLSDIGMSRSEFMAAEIDG